MTKKFSKEFSKLILTYTGIFAAIALLIVISVFNYFKTEKEEIKKSYFKELETISSILTKQINNWFNGELEDAQLISQNANFIREIENWCIKRDDKESKIIISRISQLIAEHEYKDIIISDPEFNNFICGHKSPEIIDEFEKQTGINSLKNGLISFTDFYRNSSDGSIYIDFIAPIIGKQGKNIAIIFFKQSPDTHIFPLIEMWPVSSKTAETLICRKEGDSIVYMNNLRHIENAALNLKISKYGNKTASIYASEGNEGIYEGVDYRDEKIIAYVNKIPDTPWFLVSKIDLKEIIDDSFFRFTSPFFISIILIMIAFLILAQLITIQRNKFYRNLLIAHEEYKTTLQSIGDAVIKTDKSGNIQFLNVIAQKLTGWSEHDAVGKQINDVFVIINEENREKVENPIGKVIKMGVIIGLANHTILISKSGQEIPISDSGAPIYNDKRQIIGVVLVFRDQTNERMQQKILLESKKEMTALMSNLQGMVYKCLNDRDWTMEFISKGCQELTGYEPWEIENNSSVSYGLIIHPDDKERIWNEVQAALKEKVHFQIEYRIITKKDEIKWVWEKGRGVYIDNKLTAIEGFITDITEKKNVEHALLESEEIFNHFMNNSPVYLFFKDKDIKSLKLSPNFEQMLGRPINELIGKDMFDLFPSEMAKKMIEDDKQILKDKTTRFIEEEMNGHSYLTVKFPIEIAGKVKYLAGFTMDITERKNTETALKTSEHLFHTLAANSTVGIFRTDSKGLTTYVNPKWCELAGISESVALGLGWLNSVHPEDRDGLSNGWENASFASSESTSQYRFLHTDGKVVWVKGLAIPQFDESGNLLGYIGTITDITEIKDAVEELQKTRDDLEKAQKVANMGSWIYNHKEKTLQLSEQLYSIMRIDKNYFKNNFEIFDSVVHPNDIQILHSAIQNIFKGEKALPFKFRIILKEGLERILWSETGEILYNKEGKVQFSSGIIQDITDRERSEEKILSLSEIVKESHVEIYIFDLDTFKFLFTNQEAERNIGYSSKELSEMMPINIEPLFTEDKYKEILKPLLEGEVNVLTFETIHKRKDQSTYPVEAQLQIYMHEGKRAITAFIRDISQRKKTEEALQNSNLLLRVIVNNLPDAIYMKDKDGRKVIANMADVINCGLTSEEEIVGKSDFDMFPKEIAMKFWEDDLRVLKNGEMIINREEKLVNLAGSSKWLLTSKIPYRDSNGNIIGLVGLGHDITDSKIAEEKMAKLNQTITQSPVSILMTNTKGDIEYVNPKFTEVTGYSLDEILGKNPRILKSGNQNNDFYKDLWDTILSGKNWDGEFLNKKKNGDLYWENAKISPILNDEGAIINFVAIKEDISEKKKILKELIVAKERAVEGDKLKTSFLANMSHEIRTPLNSILGFTSFITSEEDLSKDEKREFSSIINKSADSLLQIINDIIDISSLETGQLKIFSSQLLVNPIIKSLHIVFSHKVAEINKTHIKFTLLTQEETFVYADENRLIQIFTNLLNNSLKFTEKGEITFGVEKINDSSVEFIVSDTGIGIPEDMQEAVFERFRQAEGNKTRIHGGNGLGLSIVKNLLELMGGSITLDSEVGIGSKFRFTLPKRIFFK